MNAERSLPTTPARRPRTLALMGTAMLAAALVTTPAAAAPPPTAKIDVLPTFSEAMDILRQREGLVQTNSQARTDIRWLLKAERLTRGRRVPAGRRFTIERVIQVNAWWFRSRGAPRQRVILHGSDGVLFNYHWGVGFVFNPVATAGRWQKLNAKVSVVQLAKSLAPFAVQRRYGNKRWLAFEYYDDRDRPGEFIPGTSAMAQARVAQIFANAWTKTGDRRYPSMATRTMRFFSIPTRAQGGRAILPSPVDGSRFLWYPERVFPGEDPWKGAALNGFMAALIDLYSTSTRLGMPVKGSPTLGPSFRRQLKREQVLARRLASAGTRSVARALPLHDTGSWSLYGLRVPGYGNKPLVADLTYHCYHIILLRALDRRQPGLGLIDRARRWQSYVNRKRLKCPQKNAAIPGEDPGAASPLPETPDLPPLDELPPDPVPN